MQTIEVSTTDLMALLKDCHAARRIPFLQGPPGCAKSAITRQYAESISYEYGDLRLAYYAPQDVQGYPYLAENEKGEKVMRFSKPAFFPKTNQAVVVFEELNLAPRATRVTAMQVLAERRVGEYFLPEDTFMIATGNRPEDRCDTEKLPAALVNRLVNVRVRLDQPGWVKWAMKNGIDPITIAFVEFRPDLLCTFDGKKWDGQSGFACYRSWEAASEITKHSSSRHIRHALLEGTLGQGVAAEYVAFLGVHEQLPDLDDALKNPTTASVPGNPDAIYATAAGLAKKVKPSTMKNLIAYTSRLPKEFSVFAVKLAVNFNKELTKTPAFVEFITNNHELFANNLAA